MVPQSFCLVFHPLSYPTLSSLLSATHKLTLLTATDRSPWKSLFPSYRLMSLLILQFPPTPCQWKSTFKSKVIDWFEQSLRAQAGLLPSFVHFKPAFMSLSTPHPLWTSAESPYDYEVSKAVIDARMLCGRYRTDRLIRPDLEIILGCLGTRPNVKIYSATVQNIYTLY